MQGGTVRESEGAMGLKHLVDTVTQFFLLAARWGEAIKQANESAQQFSTCSIADMKFEILRTKMLLAMICDRVETT